MGLRTLIRNLREMSGRDLRRSWSAEHAPEWVFEGAGWSGVSGSLNVPDVDRPAQHVLMAYACIMARREAIGGVPIRISDGNDNLVESGPLYELLRNPNPRANWDQYVRILETHLTLWNMTAIAKVGEEGRLPDELVPLCPAYLTAEPGVHEPTGSAVAVAWNYRDPTTGRLRTYRPEELIVHVGYNPHAPLAPLSPIVALRRTMQGEIAAREQNLGMFLNDSTPKTVLETDAVLTKEQADEIMEKWEAKQKGFLNRHKTAALWGGLKAKALGLSPAEMEFLAGLKFLRTDYYMVFRVKPSMVGEMLGETGLSQGSSTEQQKVEWWEDVGLAELDLIAGLHQGLADEFGRADGARLRSEASARRSLARSEVAARARNIRRQPQATGRSALHVWHDDNAIPALVRHRLGKLDQAVKLTGLGYAPDDVNDYLDLGLPPHPDNQPRVPFSLQAIGQTEMDETVETDSAPEGTVARLDRIEELVRAERPARAKATRATFDAFLKPREKAARTRWSRYFVEQRGRVLERMGKDAKRADIERATADTLLAAVFPRKQEDADLVARLAPLWSQHMKDGVAFFEAETGTKLSMQIDQDPAFEKALAGRQIQGLRVNDTTEEDLRGIFHEAYDTGATLNEIADSIAGYYKERMVGEGASRPMTAARTQTAGIVNEGRMIAAKQVGGLKKAWLHGSPNEPRPAHLEAQERYLAEPIGLDEKFEVNGIACDAPGSTELPVEEVANCTCTVLFVKG